MARKESESGVSLALRRRMTLGVKNFVINQGIDLVGIASVESYLKVQNPPEGHTPEDILPNSKSIVVMIIAGIDFPRLDKLTNLEYPGLEEPIHDYPLGTPEYNINHTTLQCGRGGYTHLDFVAYKVARFMIQTGFNAIPIGSGHPYFQDPLHGVLSHKHAAVQAGLGQIGLSSLLLTPEFGPNCNLVSVLTDAPLVEDNPFTEELCQATQKECGLTCIRRCPQRAMGYSWEGKLPIPSDRGTIDKRACQERFRIISGAMGYSKDIHHEKQHGLTVHCGTCIRACPIGRLV